MSHKVSLDQEVTEGGITYSIQLDAELEFRNEEDPECCHVEIIQAEVAPIDGKPLKLDYEGRQIEKLIVKNYPTLTETIDGLLWSEIQTYTEDNYRDLMRGLEDARYERDL
jgi:hypothetical protein